MKFMPQLCDLALFEPMGDAALKQVASLCGGVRVCMSTGVRACQRVCAYQRACVCACVHANERACMLSCGLHYVLAGGLDVHVCMLTWVGAWRLVSCNILTDAHSAD